MLIQDTLIQADLMDILLTLRSELSQNGVDRFENFRPNGINIQTNCPFHKGGKERKPSFGINSDTGQCHCFTCGWSGGIDTMISDLFGFNDFGKYGKRWLIKRFNSLSIEERKMIQIPIRNSKQKKEEIISEDILDSYRYVHDYMYERGLTDELIEKFDIGYDKENECITFPIKNLKGQVIYVATRSVNTKFFTLPKEQNKPIYCADMFVKGEYEEAYITESFFNCLTCWKYNSPSMALIGTGNEYQYRILSNLPVRKYILAFDPDEAGRKASERFRKYVKNKIIVELEYEKPNLDINDLQESFLNLKKIF